LNKPVEGGLRILAISDLHGLHFKTASDLIDDLRPDWIVLCGDLLPDFGKIPGVGNRLQAQREFWQAYRRTFIRDFAVTTLVRGNHEIEGFQDPALCRLPAELDGHVVRLEGVPAEFGTWGWSREWQDDHLERELYDQLREAPEPWIYISHVPPYGCLDTTKVGEQVGHRPLARHLQGLGWPNALVLCGHVHESFGSMKRDQTLIVNAACGYVLIEWDKDGSRVITSGIVEE
jgi:Icc-related predicted phosphoesterase